jgi:hypothetical protein
MDDSLSADLAKAGDLTEDMTQRFLTLSKYAFSTGADGILFTCSAFGPCIEECARQLPQIPVLKPNEAMVEEVASMAHRVGLLASFAPTLLSMPREFPQEVTVITKWAEGALAALDRGDGEAHDALAARAAETLADCDLIVLAQFSLARAAASVARSTGLKVLTTPDCAVRKLRRLLVGHE